MAQQLQEQIQNEIDSHRAANQIENQVHYRPHGVTISDLRRDTVLRSELESVVENVIRQKIPSLSAARTAVVSEPQGLPPPVPNEQQQQRGGHQVLRNSSVIVTAPPQTTSRYHAYDSQDPINPHLRVSASNTVPVDFQREAGSSSLVS